MRLGSKGRYAVTALADIASQPAGRPVPLGDIALRHNLSIQYLEQIFVRLRRAGIVESARGPGGGYALARPSADITLASILVAAGEMVQTTGCKDASVTACTGQKGRCITHGLWADLGDHISQFFSTRSLADVVGPTAGRTPPNPSPAVEASL
ncbi:MAG: Rrf2 family transcriptional regulator [Caulobacterales bacterium]